MNQERFPTVRRIGRWCVRVAPRVGFGLLVLFVLVAIPWTYFNIKWGRELEARLAELKAQGMPLTLTEAAPKDVPDEQNAAVLYQEVFGVESSVHPEASSAEEGIGGLSQEEQKLIRDYRREQTPELKRKARELLARPQVQQALETLREAAKRPHCVFPIDWEAGLGTLFPHLAKFREASRIATAKALLLAEEGDVNEALDWCEVSLRMSEHAASEPTVIAQLVAYAMQAITFKAVEEFLSPVRVGPSSTDGLDRYLRQIDLPDGHAAAMIGERALGLGSLETALRNPKTWPLWKLEKLTYLDYLAKVIEASNLPYLDALPQLEAAAEDLHELPFYQGILTKILGPVFSRLINQRGRAEANLGLCRVALALKAYKYERGGYPESLAQLQRTLDWDLPEDPFSGKGFVYQRQGEGFILYSIGQDLEDDGGVPERDEQGKWRDDADIVWACSR